MSKGVVFRNNNLKMEHVKRVGIKKLLVIILSSFLVLNLTSCGTDEMEKSTELSLKDKFKNKAGEIKEKVEDKIDELEEEAESRKEERESKKAEEAKEETTEEVTTEKVTVKQVKVKDLSEYSKKKAEKWCKKHNLEFECDEDYSDKVKEGKLISQSIKAGKRVDEGTTIEFVYSLGKKPTKEELNALKKAESYSEYMHMSKQGIYEQLTSEYGEGFEPAAAKYAIEHLKADFKKNALEKAKSYQEGLAMSKNAIYDQLVSEYGEQFTPAEAKYAIDHLDD